MIRSLNDYIDFIFTHHWSLQQIQNSTDDRLGDDRAIVFAIDIVYYSPFLYFFIVSRTILTENEKINVAVHIYSMYL